MLIIEVLVLVSLLGNFLLFVGVLFVYGKVFLLSKVMEGFVRNDTDFKKNISKNKMTIMQTAMGPVIVPENVLQEGMKQKAEESKKVEKPSYTG